MSGPQAVYSMNRIAGNFLRSIGEHLWEPDSSYTHQKKKDKIKKDR